MDIRFQIRGKRDTGDEVVIVAIDEKSIKEIGRYPWPRHYIAQFVDLIANADAKVLALDVIYSEEQNIDVLRTLDRLAEKYEGSSLWNHLPEGTDKNEFLSTLREERESHDADAKLKDALGKAVSEKGMDIISAIRFVDEGEKKLTDFAGKELSDMGRELLNISAYFPVLAGEVETDKQMGADNSKLTVLTAKNRKKIMNDLLADYRPKKAVGVVNLIDPFAEYVTYQGFVDTHVDYSGIVRSEYMAIQFEGEFYPPLGVQAARIFKGIDYGKLKLWLTKELLFNDTVVPIDSWNRMIINYCGPGYTFKHYSFCDVINGMIPYTTFSNKIVFLGATAPGLADLIATPFSSQASGVEKHATVTENILHETFLVRSKGEVFHDIVAIICIGLAMGIFLPLLPPIWGGVASLLLWFGYNSYVYLRFVNDGVWLNMLYPSITVIVCFTSITLYHYISEEKKRKEVKNAFENFMDPKVVHEILKDPQNIKLGGEEKEITIFFSDIVKFTAMSEKILPVELIEYLNEYLSEMTNIILDHGGFLDKYIGDAIVAAFGAPLSQPDHAVKACLAAIDNQSKLSELNKKYRENGKPEIAARIALNSGIVLVGNVGSTNRLSYTAIGDEVNLGAKLEVANKHYGTYMMISEQTYKLARDYIEARELDIVRVTGKTKAVKVYELIDRKGKLQKVTADVLELYQNGLREYRRREWQRAMTFFEEALRKYPHDGPSHTFMRRCKTNIQNEPPKDWDGVYVLEKRGKFEDK